MKRLNNKGYLLVEIIVAFSLAMGIAYFIINLTIQFSKEEEDIYNSIKITKDINSITKVIMDDVEKYYIHGLDLDESQSSLEIWFRNDDSVYKKLSISGNTIMYKCDDSHTYNSCNSSDDFSKELDSHLTIGKISLEIYFDGYGQYAVVKIPITSKLSDENYDIKLLLNTYIR